MASVTCGTSNKALLSGKLSAESGVIRKNKYRKKNGGKPR